MARNNTQIWRIARWLFDQFCDKEQYEEWAARVYEEASAWEFNMNNYYDKALELQRKMNDGSFVGGDSHCD